MRNPSPVAVLLLAGCLLAPAPAEARSRRGPRAGDGRGALVLDGERVAVRWSDGDSFKILSGPLAGNRTRLQGVNALESFGPVHRWGGWSARELQQLAKRTPSLAAAGVWTCAAAGPRDRYGRLLVACPDLALALARDGQVMVFAMDGPADPALVAAQRAAQAAGAGMWAKGVPDRIVSSTHSADEPGLGRRGAYDRLVDPRTGAAEIRSHARVYEECEEVCAGEGAGRACLVHVSYARRYRDRPACVR
jgi:micrococcal nuclease